MYYIKTKYALYAASEIRIGEQDIVEKEEMEQALKKYHDGTLKHRIVIIPISNNSSPLIIKKDLTEKEANSIMDKLFKEKTFIIDCDMLEMIDY